MLSLCSSPEQESCISVRISKSQQKGTCVLQGHWSPCIQDQTYDNRYICPVANVTVNFIWLLE